MLDAVKLRAATVADCRLVWEWRNDRTARHASFNTKFIPYKEHERWFESHLADPHTRIFIVMTSLGDEVGYVRFKIVGKEAEIALSVDVQKRGKGYGTAAIQAGCHYMLTTGAVDVVVARVRRDNPASLGAFRRAGYTVRRYKLISGIEACEMIYKGNEINEAPAINEKP